MKAFILCGGFGTRLRSVIGETQKAVAEVDGKPFLMLVIERLVAAGLDELVFCTHYLSEQIERTLQDHENAAVRSSVVLREEKPLGTGGAVLNAVHSLGCTEDFIVLNADTYVDSEAYGLASRSSSPAIVVRDVSDCMRYGAVRIEESGMVSELCEKGVSGPGCISMGIYRLNPADLPDTGIVPCSMEKDILPRLVASGRLKAIRYTGDFIDIGTPESLAMIRQKGFTSAA
jgi:NDP-sugar pyrophosphorylase family protein